MNTISIAIDGPAGAGKSTVAKLVAKKLDFLYIDTGAMYRALTYKAMEQDLNLHDGQKLNDLLLLYPIDFINETGKRQRVVIDKQDITEAIRSPEVTKNVSLVSTHQLVRETMVENQRLMAADCNVVMDGRDIGTHVLTNATFKFFLTASIDERASRRYKEILDKGYTADLEKIKEEIFLRDKKDQERAISPLKKAKDAILLDTSNLSIEEVINKILDYVKKE